MVAYLTTVFTIQHLLRDKQPYVLLTWFRAHNIILSLGSALLLALMFEEIAPIVFQHGLRYAICDSASWTPVRIRRERSPIIQRGRLIVEPETRVLLYG
jgi:fatty acid elongase 3